MPHLVATLGPDLGRRFELALGGRTILGRHPDCNIVVEVGAVSRQHCAIVQQGSDFLLEDLKSRNGTQLNGEAVQSPLRLYDGDVLRICEAEYTFHGAKRAVERSGDDRWATVKSNTVAGNPAVPANASGDQSKLFRAMMVDDEAQGPTSTVMSRFDAASNMRSGAWNTSPEVKLAALLEVMQHLGKAVSLDAVLNSILNALFKIFLQADRGFIVLQEPDGTLVPRYTKARREETADAIRISRTICRQVMSSKEALLSADAATDERFEMSQSIADFRIRSMMCAPLIDSEGNALGVLQIDTLDQRKRFQPEDLELLVSIAAQASLSVQNAQLHEQALRQREVERDMELAREVQHGFLPDDKPKLAGYRFFDYYEPADQVGGDYYDYIPLADGRLAVVVADVVGHGIAAALLMAKLSAEVRFALYNEAQPADAITRLNERLCRMQVQRFVTLVLLVIDPRDSKATVVSAGHMLPIHRKVDGSVVELGDEIVGIPLGIVDSMTYEQISFPISSGDMLTLYTDGINECADISGALYSIDRLRDHIRVAVPSAETCGPAIVEDVRRFLGKAVQNDDMCLVCFDRVDA